MKRDRFAKPVGPPCEKWQEWARDAVKFRSKDNLMHAVRIDPRTERHMKVEHPPDPLPPVLQQYPLPRTEKSRHLCDSDDDEDDDLVDTFTLLAILESQREAQANKSTPSAVNVNKKDAEKDSHCITIDPSVSKHSPVSLRGGLLKLANDEHLPDDMRFFGGPGVHREGCI